MKRRFTRRRFLQTMLGAGAIGAIAASYGHWLESEWLELTERHVNLDTAGPDRPRLRVLHLSDLHASRVVSLEYLARAIDEALTLLPDLICVTGDFITRRYDVPSDYPEVLRKLSVAAPTFAVLGNHDGGPWSLAHGGYATSIRVRDILSASGITCLRNQSARISLRGRAVEVIGLGDLWSGECQPKPAFASLPSSTDATRLVLSHNPDSKHLFGDYSWDLLLSGHTHGGQIGLPGLAGAFAPVMDKRFIEGLHRWENHHLHVSRGVGCLFGVRLFCRPQATLLTLA